MQIVIDIPEKWFDDMVKEEFCEVDELCAIIQHGTPLPKGHGRLGDLDELAHKMIRADIDDFEGRSEAVAGLMLWFCHKADTIIEADKAESDEEGNRCYQCQHYNSTFDLCHLRNLFGYCDFKPNGECMESEEK